MESGDFEGDSDTGDWDFEEDESVEPQAQSLFSQTRLQSIDKAIEYDTHEFGFNLREYRKQVRGEKPVSALDKSMNKQHDSSCNSMHMGFWASAYAEVNL